MLPLWTSRDEVETYNEFCFFTTCFATFDCEWVDASSPHKNVTLIACLIICSHSVTEAEYNSSITRTCVNIFMSLPIRSIITCQKQIHSNVTKSWILCFLGEWDVIISVSHKCSLNALHSNPNKKVIETVDRDQFLLYLWLMQHSECEWAQIHMRESQRPCLIHISESQQPCLNVLLVIDFIHSL